MEPNFPRAARRKSSIGPKTILRIIAKYALFGGVWVTCSDLLVYLHGGETGQDAAIGLLKGLLFVAVSAVLLYAIISNSVHGTVAERDALRERLKSWNLDANDMVWLLDGNGRILEVNDRAVDAYGLTESEFCEKAFVDLLADKSQFAESWDRLLEDGTLRTEAMHRRADGTAFPVELSARRFDIDGSIYMHGIGRDMTERRDSERELVKLKDAYAALSQTNQCMNTCSDRSDLFQRTCEIAVNCMHIQLAWVGIIDDEQRSIAIVAKAGPASSYTEHLSVSIDPNRDTSRGPAGRAVLTGVPVVVNDLWNSDGFQPWTQKLIEYGFKSWAAFPLACDGNVVGVLTLYSDDRRFFTDQIAELFREMTQNLSMTLERLAARATQLALEAELKKLRTAVEQSPVTVLISDANGSIQYVNPAFTHSSGYSADEVLGKNPRILKSDEMSTEEYASMWNQLTQGNTWMGHFHNRRKDGSLYWEEAVISPVKDTNGNITHFISVKQDVTARREAEAKANFLAFHDPLTELPNRLVAKRDMTEAMLEADLTGNKAALLFIDVDNFKKVNDSLGHAVGDRLLQELVERIRSCMREDDSLARISGDEFLIVARGIHGADVVSSVAKRIHASLVSPLSIDEMQIVTTVSIGIAVYPDDGKSFDELHRHADLAMYSAKKDGRNTFRIYSGSMESDVRQYMLTVAALRRALDRSEFVIHYQPQLHLETRAVRAVEALLRWNHPELGLVPPTEFISTAEDCGLIIELGHWVVREACRQAAIWRASGLPDLTIAINISPLQLRRDDFKYMITAALDESGIAPGVLELELTESALIQDFTNTSALLSSLKDLGIHTALDDFGTGYSNFISLRHLNLDTLKIDQSFIRNMTSNRRDVAIIRSIVQLARNLGLATVAEGVETDECLEVVRRAGCDHGQGFLLARPMSSEAVREFILGRSPSKGDEKVAEDSYPE